MLGKVPHNTKWNRKNSKRRQMQHFFFPIKYQISPSTSNLSLQTSVQRNVAPHPSSMTSFDEDFFAAHKIINIQGWGSTNASSLAVFNWTTRLRRSVSCLCAIFIGLGAGAVVLLAS